MTAGQKIVLLLVEHDKELVNRTYYALEADGFEVVWVSDIRDKAWALAEFKPCLVLLENSRGVEVCRYIRQRRGAPYLPIITMGNTNDIGLASTFETQLGEWFGADDHIQFPVDAAILIARVRALLRRMEPSGEPDILSFQDIKVAIPNRTVTRGSCRLHLGPTEFRLLVFLMKQPGKVFSRDQILDEIWGELVALQPRAVTVSIQRLRKAITYNGDIDVIRTVPGTGYSLDIER